MTFFVYVNTSKQVGDVEHIKVFAITEVAEVWFEENDSEGVALEYEVLMKEVPDSRLVLVIEVPARLATRSSGGRSLAGEFC